MAHPEGVVGHALKEARTAGLRRRGARRLRGVGDRPTITGAQAARSKAAGRPRALRGIDGGSRSGAASVHQENSARARSHCLARSEGDILPPAPPIRSSCRAPPAAPFDRRQARREPPRPEFILQKDAQDQTSGTFEAAALFVDIAGFSSLTTKLMQHGREGAETLARALRFYFESHRRGHRGGRRLHHGLRRRLLHRPLPAHAPPQLGRVRARRRQSRARFVTQNRLFESRFGSFPF